MQQAMLITHIIINSYISKSVYVIYGSHAQNEKFSALSQHIYIEHRQLCNL